MHIHDISFSNTFWTDWESTPEKIQTRFNKTIKLIALTREFLPSAQAHKIKDSPSGLWIAYVSVGKNSWRFLFSISSSGTLVVERIMSHNSMDLYLRK